MVGFISFHFGLLGLHLLSFWLHFLSFSSFGPSFSFILAFFFCYVRLSWAWTLSEGIGGEYRFLGMCSFRGASAKLPQNTEAKPVTKLTQRRNMSGLATIHPQNQIPMWDMETELHQDIQIISNSFKLIFYLLIPHCTLSTSPSATFREGHPSAKLPRPEPCAFFNEYLISFANYPTRTQNKLKLRLEVLLCLAWILATLPNLKYAACWCVFGL